MTPAWLLPGAEILQLFRVKGTYDNIDPESLRAIRGPRRSRHRSREKTAILSLHDQVVALHKKGKTRAQIQKQLSLCRTAVWKHLRSLR